MGSRTRSIVLLLAVTAHSCGGGGGTAAGGSGSGGTGNSSFGTVQLLEHSPADQAVQVAANTTILLTFDAEMAIESFGDEDTWLRAAGSSSNVPGTFTRGTGGRVAFQPASPLALETDYVFQLSPLTSDLAGRILDVTRSFTFRTLDQTPPSYVDCDVANGATGVARTRSFRLTFSEALGASSVNAQSLYLRDGFGGRFAADLTIGGSAVVLTPHADLPGDRQYWLVATTALADRAGNRLPATAQVGFRTIGDTTPPSVVAAWPAQSSTGRSPRIQPTFSFDESMDPATVEAASLLFQDEFGSVVPFAIDARPNQRTLRIRPTVTLQTNRRYTLAFMLGAAAATDVSGNNLSATQALTFTTGADATAPTIASSTPASGETRVPGTLVANVVFDEALDPAWVDTTTVRLTAGGASWASVVELVNGTTVRVTPVLSLPTNTTCTLSFLGGQDGIHDVAGNVLATDQVITFTTSGDAATPRAMLMPPDGAAGIAMGSRISVVFDAAMDPSTLTATTVRVTDDFGAPLSGTLSVGGGNRVVTFTPASPLSPSTYYRIRVVGGSAGARRASGNWFAQDQTSRFRTGTANDITAPQIAVTVNGIDSSRRDGLVLPPSGFSIDVVATDAGGQWVDMGSIEVVLQGGSAPGSEALFAAATIGFGSYQVVIPANTPLAAGNWTLAVRARDLCGNQGTSNTVAFTVESPTANMLPFEKTQVVWVRTDLDRDGNGRSDFADDMLRLGFATAGDPVGTNAFVERVVRDAILAKCNSLYKRGSRGEPIDSGSVGIRFTTRQPIGLQHMQMALGGYDPEGNRTRTYGADSTGVLGRAYYDYRNGNVGERNISNSPGLGVFPGEMWLYQTKIHIQVWPSYQTTFAQKFRPICPDMGGTPAGSHALDQTVLSPSFEYATANSTQRARWHTVMNAADDWASVMGIILAHEVGHSVGLVAPGSSPTGLFGDSSLHNTFASAAEVMASSVGYEAMTALDYQFRDTDLAYLRQRILLR
jgi:hypothetical protein